MLLAKRWLEARGDAVPEFTVLSVDHGLRSEAAEEARRTGVLAASFGFTHHILVWEGKKPKTAIQAAARRARYDLMTGFCRAQGIPALATAHNADDQAETFLMRLRRGSGVDGLASMEPITVRSGVDLLRPLLSLTRSELESYLASQNQDWLEDPSNRDTHYERIRIRKALGEGALDIPAESVVLSARRLARARHALDAVTAQFLRKDLILHDAGYATLPADALMRQPGEIMLRTLIRMARAFGGGGSVPQLAKAEAALAKLQAGASGATLGGCHFSHRKGQMIATREYGRMSRAQVNVAPGSSVLWDNRFRITANAVLPSGTILKPLGTDGAQAARLAGADVKEMPRSALLSLPSFWRGGHLIHTPFLGYVCLGTESFAAQVTVSFANRDVLFEAL